MTHSHYKENRQICILWFAVLFYFLYIAENTEMQLLLENSIFYEGTAENLEEVSASQERL